MPLPPKTYLGDSVYVEYDGFCLVLTTENGPKPSNRIMLEPQVIDTFNEYCQAVARAIKEETTESP